MEKRKRRRRRRKSVSWREKHSRLFFLNSKAREWFGEGLHRRFALHPLGQNNDVLHSRLADRIQDWCYCSVTSMLIDVEINRRIGASFDQLANDGWHFRWTCPEFIAPNRSIALHRHVDSILSQCRGCPTGTTARGKSTDTPRAPGSRM